MFVPATCRAAHGPAFMTIVEKLNRTFEGWIDPFQPRAVLRPPDKAMPFLLHFVRQAKVPFFALLLLGGAVALVEAGLFYYVGRLVDILDAAPRGEGWSGLLAAHAGELLAMLVVVVVVRFVVGWLSAAAAEARRMRGTKCLASREKTAIQTKMASPSRQSSAASSAIMLTA